jgi:hypothetical protein
MCWFCRITDLGILLSNFSRKNYSLKEYTCFRKVVVLVTQSTTKLDLQFLDFFWFSTDFTRCSWNTKGSEDPNYFQALWRHKSPQPYPRFAPRPLEVLGTLQCGPQARPAAESAGLQRGRGGRGSMTGRGTMGYPAVTDWWPESGLGSTGEGGYGGATARRSPRAQCRRGDSTAGATSGRASFSMRLRAGSRG